MKEPFFQKTFIIKHNKEVMINISKDQVEETIKMLEEERIHDDPTKSQSWNEAYRACAGLMVDALKKAVAKRT